MLLRAAVFLRRAGAFGLGHLGWAFENVDGTFWVGSVENPGSQPVTPPESKGAWELRTRDPIGVISRFNYDEFKVLWVREPNPEGALKLVYALKAQPFYLFGRNCLNDTYDILKIYGVKGLPDVNLSYTPVSWYDRLPGGSYQVKMNKRAEKKGG